MEVLSPPAYTKLSVLSVFLVEPDMAFVYPRIQPLCALFSAFNSESIRDTTTYFQALKTEYFEGNRVGYDENILNIKIGL